MKVGIRKLARYRLHKVWDIHALSWESLRENHSLQVWAGYRITDIFISYNSLISTMQFGDLMTQNDISRGQDRISHMITHIDLIVWTEIHEYQVTYICVWKRIDSSCQLNLVTILYQLCNSFPLKGGVLVLRCFIFTLEIIIIKIYCFAIVLCLQLHSSYLQNWKLIVPGANEWSSV